MTEKRLGFLLGASIVVILFTMGCSGREERITLAAATGVDPSSAKQFDIPTPTPTATETPAAAFAPSIILPVSATSAAPTSAGGEANPRASETPTETATPTPTPPPPMSTPTPGAMGPPSGGVAVITLAEHDRTLRLRPGDRLVLSLGDELRWTLQVSDGTVLAPATGTTLPPDTQAVLVAQQPGAALVRGLGLTSCAGIANCTPTSVYFNLTVEVG